MPDDKKKSTESEYDIFIASLVYPEAGAVFAAPPRKLAEVKDDCIIVLDTNTLFVPYLIGKDSLEQIQKTYKHLIAQKRLRIPGQVAREFAKNRALKLTELYQRLSQKKNSVQELQMGRYPLLENVPEYQEVVALEDAINRQIQDYRRALGRVLDHVQAWNWDDPVSALYSELFTPEIIVDPTFDKEKVREEIALRYQHSIPPGYKDASKDDGGIGDFLIWKTILEIGKANNKSVVLVSGDEKIDWRYKIDKQVLYPRYELVDEFRRHSGGNSFHLIQFYQLLDLYGASEEIVQEVRKTEIKETKEQFSAVLDTGSATVLFPFTINKSFKSYGHHPITIPRAYYEQVQALGFESDNVLIISPFGSVRGTIYYAEAGWGRYYQIVARGGNYPEDPLNRFDLGQEILVEIVRMNDAVQVSYVPA